MEYSTAVLALAGRVKVKGIHGAFILEYSRLKGYTIGVYPRILKIKGIHVAIILECSKFKGYTGFLLFILEYLRLKGYTGQLS